MLVLGCTPLLIASLVLAQIVASAQVRTNRTIDDQNGDSVSGMQPSYSPAGAWSQGASCNGCKVNSGNVDTHKVFDGTWHDSTYHPDQPERGISVNFTGVAVYVFCLVVNTIPSVTTFTNLTFSLDGEHVSTFQHLPDKTSDVLYDVPVYVNTSLANIPHELLIQAQGSTTSLVLFDYIAYTVEEEDHPSSTPSPLLPSTTKSTLHTSSAVTIPTSDNSPSSMTNDASHRNTSQVVAIVTGVLGALALLALVISIIVFRRRLASYSHHDSKQLENGSPSPRARPSTYDISSTAATTSSSSFPESPRTERAIDVPPVTPPRTHAPRSKRSIISRTASVHRYVPRALRGPPSHSVDVPRPALSATGTERSMRFEELERELRSVQGLLQELLSVQRDPSRVPVGLSEGGPSSTPKKGTKTKYYVVNAGPSSDPSRGTGRRHGPSVTALRARVARLSAQLEDERRLLVETPPRR